MLVRNGCSERIVGLITIRTLVRILCCYDETTKSGVQKSVGTKGVIRIAVDDLLYTNNWRIKTYAPENSLDVYFDYDWHNQFVRVTHSCSLGNTKLKAVKLKSASEEERKRIGN